MDWDAHTRKRIEAYLDGDETALREVYGCFAGSNEPIIKEAASALADGMAGLSAGKRIRLLERMGEYLSLEWYDEWRDTVPNRLRGLLDRREYFAVLAAGSAHPNGFYRERCIGELAAYGGAALPFLLVRVNDWVEIIRRAAMKEALRILESCGTKDLFEALPFIYRLGQCGRRDEENFTKLMELVENRLADAAPQLTPEIIQTLDRQGRRICYRVTLRRGFYSAEQWKKALSLEKDPFTRKIAAHGMLVGLEREDALSILLSHKDGALRLLALENRWALEGADWKGYEGFLCDPRRAVREMARFAVKNQKPGYDFQAYYRNSLTEAPREGAAAGLGETGSAEDAPLLRPLLHSERAGLRKTALAALGRLLEGKGQDLYYACLLRGGGVSKIAFHLLQEGGMYLGCERLRTDLEAAEDPAVRRRLCALLGRSRPWESLPWLLRLQHHEDEETADAVRGFLAGWQAGYQRPLPGELEACQKALEEQRKNMPEKLVRGLEFEFRHAR